MFTERPNPLDEIKKFFKSQSILPRLITINGIVWLVASFVIVIAFLFNISDVETKGWIVEYLGIPADINQLVYRPWTLLTYMFLHINFWHILFNMLWLFWFGKIFLEFLNKKQLLTTYIMGGLAGAALYIIAYNIFPAFSDLKTISHALGASAAVMAIVTAISFYVPNYTIQLFLFGRVKIVYIAIVLFVLDFFMIRSDNSGGHLAHIGGAVYGFLYALSLQKGRDWSRIFESFSIKKFLYKQKSSNKQSGQGIPYQRPISDDEYNDQRATEQEKTDRILDKISKSGYESLTKAEKEFLFKSSKK